MARNPPANVEDMDSVRKITWKRKWQYTPVHSEEDQPWDFFGRNDAKAETPVLWPPHVKSWLIGKDSDAGRDWGQEEKETTADEMAGWHHWLDGCESQWTPEVGDGQGCLACCDSWGRKESETTEQLIWSDLIWFLAGKSHGQRSLVVYNPQDSRVGHDWTLPLGNILCHCTQ